MIWCEEFPGILSTLESLITENRIFKQRNVDIGFVDEKTIMQYGFSGPMVRGSGLAWDLRRAQPYECYDEFELSKAGHAKAVQLFFQLRANALKQFQVVCAIA